MPPGVLQIPENGLPVAGLQGFTDFGSVGYGGRAPLLDQALTVTIFRLFALDYELELDEGANRLELDMTIKNDHVIEKAALLGYYNKE